LDILLLISGRSCSRILETGNKGDTMGTRPFRMLLVFIRKTFADIVELIDNGQYEAAKKLASSAIDTLDSAMANDDL